MINKLAVECGHNVVNKIKVMFEDMNNSQVVIKEYKNSQFNQLKAFDFAVEILSYSSWPSFEGCRPKLPQ